MSISSPISLAELSERVNLHPSTAHRLLATLDKRRFVYQDPVSKLYSPGVKLLYPVPGLRQYHVLVNLVTPSLREIAQQTGEGASMAILSGHHAMVVAKAASDRSVDVSLRDGVLVPLHCTAVGKAILAHLEPVVLRRILHDEGLPPSTPNTIVDVNYLQSALEEIRQRGYSIDNEEWEPGIRCVAVPVFSSVGKIFGAISVSGPSGRLTREQTSRVAGIIQDGVSKLAKKLR
jgi:IclR family acetate operon transcriptional repressor